MTPAFPVEPTSFAGEPPPAADPPSGVIPVQYNDVTSGEKKPDNLTVSVLNRPRVIFQITGAALMKP